MTAFRKRPVVIEATQWLPGAEVAGVCLYNVVDHIGCTGTPHIHTLEGVMQVSPGDFIITGVKGERYPCKPDIFAATYDPADALTAHPCAPHEATIQLALERVKRLETALRACEREMTREAGAIGSDDYHEAINLARAALRPEGT